ncbi:uncharacterized protein Dwil_GK27226 [Drosophila willistoni]|uniref:Uncharacterized protein n=1 Tax=Drosophila willistoni TaxID=7260 RepID=A0A0Q9X1U5_DROWI|nr:uncharacterized protein LOC26529228 [Drosophila willistoni]KRF98731.1 uncharacterized protein Dwil_GK27226 [Drosophila willistoni]
MPPYCCGGRLCAEDVTRERRRMMQEQGYDTADESLTVPGDYVRPLSLKFYARHDWPYFNCTDDEIQKMRAQHDPESLKLSAKLSPTVAEKGTAKEPTRFVVKRATAVPITENQIYGWYEDRAHRYLKRDRGVFVFPREADPMIQQILTDRMQNGGLSR